MILKRLVLKTFFTSSQPFLGADYDIFHYSTKLKMPSMHLRTWCNKISDTILSFTANYESLETHRLPLKLTTNDRHESIWYLRPKSVVKIKFGTISVL